MNQDGLESQGQNVQSKLSLAGEPYKPLQQNAKPFVPQQPIATTAPTQTKTKEQSKFDEFFAGKN